MKSSSTSCAPGTAISSPSHILNTPYKQQADPSSIKAHYVLSRLAAASPMPALLERGSSHFHAARLRMSLDRYSGRGRPSASARTSLSGQSCIFVGGSRQTTSHGGHRKLTQRACPSSLSAPLWPSSRQ